MENENWSKEFEEFWEGHTPFAGYDNEGIKDFIRQLLQTARQKERERIKGIIKEKFKRFYMEAIAIDDISNSLLQAIEK